MNTLDNIKSTKSIEHKDQYGVVRKVFTSYNQKNESVLFYTSEDGVNASDFKLFINSNRRSPAVDYILLEPYGDHENSFLLRYSSITGELIKIVSKKFTWELDVVFSKTSKDYRMRFYDYPQGDELFISPFSAFVYIGEEEFDKAIDYLMKREKEAHRIVKDMTGIDINELLKYPVGTSLLKFKS